METRKTVCNMTDEQRSDIVATMAGAIPADLLFEEAQAIIDKKDPFVVEIREAFAKRRLNVIVPADDEWFDLEVDNDVNPIDVVTSAGFNADGWNYLGPNLSGKRTYTVKLVRLGYVHNLVKAKERADEMGYRLIEGQAREPFKARFLKPDGKGFVVFGGSEWLYPYPDSPRVVYLYGFEDKWYSDFLWSDDDFDDDWRWLVVGK